MVRVMKPPPSVDGPALTAAAERSTVQDGAQDGAQDSAAPAAAAAVAAVRAEQPPARSWQDRFGRPPRRPLLMGLAGALLLVIGGFGAGGVLIHDPVLTNSPLGFWRYGHGREVANFLIYTGVALMAWAWVRLGRDVIAHRVGGRGVLTTAFVWMLPMLAAPPLFTRDIFSYLAQGALPLAGLDPYAVGPEALPGVFSDNVHYFWQETPAPYGPLFIMIAKAVAWVTGDAIILGVVLMRLALLPGLALFIWALPELTRRMGGRAPVALWVAVANPMMVIHMVGGGHNDLLVVGLLAAGALLTLRGAHVGGIALVTAAMAVKASAAVALPFLVLVWAARLPGSPRARIVKAAAAGIGVFVAVFAAFTFAAGVSLGWLPALSAPSMIVNWMSIPTGVGEFTHTLVGLLVDVPKQPFINVTRVLGGLLLVYIAWQQWWASRDGGPDAVRRAGIVLLAVAVLSPAMLPWYVSWGIALIAAVPWTVRGLQVAVFVSLMLVIFYYPNGEDALYNWGYLALWAAGACLAAVSLLRPDPLRIAAGRRQHERQRSHRPAPAVLTSPGAAAGAERGAG
jgi:alpha-1,6-mannosyltransferase